MKPEEEAEIILWDWLKTKSSFIKEVYFNRVNILNAPVFTTTGINKKPDLILKIDDGYSIKFYAVEVKSSNKSKNILNASKIISNYFKNYSEKRTLYFIAGKQIELNGFLIATEQSSKGYLFKNEQLSIDNSIQSQGDSKYIASTKYKIIPKIEGGRTFEFVRYLWEEYGKIRNNYLCKLDCGIIIGNSEDNFYPFIFITNFNHLKKRWSQRWWKI